MGVPKAGGVDGTTAEPEAPPHPTIASADTLRLLIGAETQVSSLNADDIGVFQKVWETVTRIDPGKSLPEVQQLHAELKRISLELHEVLLTLNVEQGAKQQVVKEFIEGKSSEEMEQLAQRYAASLRLSVASPLNSGLDLSGEVSKKAMEKEARQFSDRIRVSTQTNISPEKVKALVKAKVELFGWRTRASELLDELSPRTHWKVLYGVAMQGHADGRYELASRKLTEALGRCGKDSEGIARVRVALADCERRCRRFDEAEGLLEQVCSQTGSPREAHATWGLLLLDRNMFSGARTRFLLAEDVHTGAVDDDVLRKDLRLPPLSWKAGLAVALLQLGNADEARRTITDALGNLRKKSESDKAGRNGVREFLDYVRQAPTLMGDSKIRDAVELRVYGWVEKDYTYDDFYVKNQSTFPVHNVKLTFRGYGADGKVLWSASNIELNGVDPVLESVAILEKGKKKHGLGEHNLLKNVDGTCETTKVMMEVECDEGRSAVDAEIVW